MSTMPRIETDIPETDEIELARKSGQALAKHISNKFEVTIRGTDEVVELPLTAARLLVDVLTQIAEGNAVTVIPIHAELTTQQAAEYLGVSRPYLIKLLESNEIPYRFVGSHRRIYFRDLKSYRDNVKAKRRETLAELVRDAEENDMGY